MNEKGFATISVIYLTIILLTVTYVLISISSIFYNQNLAQNSADQVSIKLALTKDCNSLDRLLILNKVELEECEVSKDSVKVKVKKILDENVYTNLFKLGLNLREITAISKAS
jgi:cell division protein FtsX